MIQISEERFNRAKEESERYYAAIGSVRCPYFGEEVVFNRKGLTHLKFKGERQARLRVDQYIRFRLLKLAPEILSKSHTLQGIHRRNSMERKKINNRWETVMQPVIYYEFVSVVKEKTRVRVIIKQVGGGKRYFWSIIPFWKMDNMTGKKRLHDGKPEID